MPTYKHLIANSVTHVQLPADPENPQAQTLKTIQFAGKPGGAGFYQTEDPHEIKHLDWLAKHPQVQLEKIEESLVAAIASPEADIIHKPADPAIQQATEDVRETAARHQAPELAAAQGMLAKMIAQTSAAGSQE